MDEGNTEKTTKLVGVRWLRGEIFLSEIFCKKERVKKVISLIGFEGAFIVESQGHGGGLAFLWRNKEEISLRTYNKNHIDVTVDIEGWSKYILTELYSEPDRARHQEIWELICKLNTDSDLPWCMIVIM